MTQKLNHETLLQAFSYWEDNAPDRVYLTQPFPDGRVVDYTWREVGDQVRRMAAHLRSLELPEHSHIALAGKNSAHWIMADLAIWVAGYVTVPIFPTVNADTAEHVLEHSEVKLLFIGKLDGINDTWNDFKKGISDDLPRIALPMAPEPDARQWDHWDEIIAAAEPLRELLDVDKNDLATIVYTSGSTGKPKGVMHSFAGMVAVAQGTEQKYSLTPDDRMLSYLPLAHVAERTAVEASSLYFGFHVFFADTLDTFQQDLKRARPTLFLSVPRLWTKFYQAICQKIPPARQKLLFCIPVVSGLIKRKILGELGLDHVRYAITGSAPLPSEIVRWYRDLGLELLDAYGMTENFSHSHASNPGRVRIGYVGESAPGVETRIDPVSGEIQVKSSGQMLGYYKQPDKTKECMTEDGFFKTGDMGEIDEQGRLRITGRVKDMFKTSKGKYVVPMPIENELGNHPDIEVACVTGGRQPQPYGLIMLAEERRAEQENGSLDRKRLEAELRELREQINARVERHERLAFLVVVKDAWTIEEGYLTPTMKIKRKIIEQSYACNEDNWVAAKQPVIWE